MSNHDYYDFDENNVSYEGRHDRAIVFIIWQLSCMEFKIGFWKNLFFSESKEVADDLNEDSDELHYKDRLSNIQDYYRRMSRAKAFSAWAGKRSQASDVNHEELLRYLVLLNSVPSKKAFSAWAGKWKWSPIYGCWNNFVLVFMFLFVSCFRILNFKKAQRVFKMLHLHVSWQVLTLGRILCAIHYVCLCSVKSK